MKENTIYYHPINKSFDNDVSEFTLGLNKTLRLQFISSNDFWLSEWNTEQFLQDLLIISLIGFVWGDYSVIWDF